MSNLWNPRFPFDPGRFPFFYGWIIVLGATFGILFSIPGQTMGFSVFTDILIRELGLTRVQLSYAYLIGTVGSGLTLPWLGGLHDRWGSRRMVVFSALVTSLVLFYLSQSGALTQSLAALLPESWGVPVAFTVIGLGFYLIRASAQGVLTMSCRNAMGKWFNARRGIAAAISQVAVALGFAIAPLVLHNLIERYTYAGAWALLGWITLAFMVPAGWLLFRDNPEECGLHMDGLHPVPPSRPNLDMVIHHDFTRTEALRSYAFWAFNLSLAFFAFFSTAYTFHIESLGEEFGFETSRIIGLFVPMAVISVLANLVTGILSGRFRVKYLLALMNAGALAGAFGLMRLDTPAGLAAYVAGNGICGGCFVNLTAIIWPRFFGRTHLGAISGVAMSSMVIASGLGPIFFSQLHAWTGTYHPALAASLAIPALLLGGSFFADNPQRRIQA